MSNRMQSMRYILTIRGTEEDETNVDGDKGDGGGDPCPGSVFLRGIRPIWFKVRLGGVRGGDENGEDSCEGKTKFGVRERGLGWNSEPIGTFRGGDNDADEKLDQGEPGEGRGPVGEYGSWREPPDGGEGPLLAW